MKITREQVQQFKTQGYTVVKDFFNEQEILAMRADLERLRREGKFNNVRTEGDSKTVSQQKANLQICPLYPKSELFRALPFKQEVLDTIPQLIGDPVILHLDQVFLKPARHGTGTNWHQDNAYFKIPDPFLGTAMWIAVHDATIANGTIRLIPDLAKEKLEHVKDPESNHHIRCYPPEEKAVYAEVPAGGVVFFCYGVPHATGANNTDKDRAGVAYHFLNGVCYTEEYKQTFKPIGTVLSGKGYSAGEKEYGFKPSWTAECEKALAGQLAAAK
ncbi:MAG TPA: phytanoyl-CoA dioxygenase family protein [Planctomycetota bacterium]|nr:phytanoyl-CoA dioxygenase family protein [Planctomycetota bacterium]